jgi:hypothetical protein
LKVEVSANQSHQWNPPFPEASSGGFFGSGFGSAGVYLGFHLQLCFLLFLLLAGLNLICLVVVYIFVI